MSCHRRLKLMSADLNPFLKWAHDANLNFRALLEAAAAQGLPLPTLLSCVEFESWADFCRGSGATPPSLTLDYHSEDGVWIEVLVEAVGSEDRADAILAATNGWMGRRSARAWLGEERARRALAAAVRTPESPVNLTSAVGEATTWGVHPGWAEDQAITKWPLSALLMVEGLWREELRGSWERRGPWKDQLLELRDVVGEERAVALHEKVVGGGAAYGPVDLRFYDLLRQPSIGESEGVRWALQRVREARSREVWVATAYRWRFDAGACLLELHDEGATFTSAAASLLTGGYAVVAVLKGLLKNGLGPQNSLLVLRSLGGDAAQFVSSMRNAGFLDPEIREELKSLGLDCDDVQHAMSTLMAVSGE